MNVQQCYVKVYFGTVTFSYFLDDSDEPTGLVRHLPRRLLGAQAEKRKRKSSGIGNRLSRLEADGDNDSNDDEVMEPEQGQWSHRDPALVGTKIPPFIKPVLSVEDRETFESLSTAFDWYKLFQPDTFAEEIVYQSKLYALQKDHKKAMEYLSRDAYRYSYSPYNNFFSMNFKKMSFINFYNCLQMHGGGAASQRVQFCTKEEDALGAQARL